MRAVRAATVAATLVGLLALVGLASRGGRPAVGSGTEVEAVAQLRDVVLTLMITLFPILLVVLLLAIRRFGVPPEARGRSPLRGLLVFFTLVTLVWLVVATTDGKPLETVEEYVLGEDILEGRAPPGREDDPRASPPAQFEWEIALAVIGGAAAVTAFLVLRRRGNEPEARTGEEMADDLVAVIEETLEDLRGEADPRRAVIAAYAQMERTLGRHGAPRRVSEAPFEYLGRILEELRVRASAALALTELFERARFSLHTIDARMKEEAIEALAAVRDDLRAVA